MIITNFRFNNKLYWSFFIVDRNASVYFESQIIDYVNKHACPDTILIFRLKKDVHETTISFERIPSNDLIECKYFNFDYKDLTFKDSDNIPIENRLHAYWKFSLFEFIFNKYDCVLNSNHNSYYELPSRYNSTHFIRVGNMFTNSNEIFSLSVFILDYLKTKPAVIYCDSPSIFPLIYGAIHVLNQSENNSSYFPIVKCFSFSSIKNKEVVNSIDSVYFISTSITGSLSQELNKIGVDSSKIIVIINFNRGTKHYLVVEDFARSIIDKIKGLDCLPAEQFLEKYEHKRFPIRLETDHFIPAAPKISSILISSGDAPEGLSEMVERYYSYPDFIRCYAGKNSNGKTRDLYFDISKVFRSLEEPDPNYFERKSYKLLLTMLPISIDRIIYIDELESKYMALLIQKFYLSKFGKEVEAVHYRAVKPEAGSSIDIPTCFLVCSSCISEGKKIFDVSRLLRNHDRSRIIYFNGIIRSKTSEALKLLKTSLTYGIYEANTYQLISIEQLLLPNEDSDTITWKLEEDFLNSLLSGFDDFSVRDILPPARAYFQKRFDELKNGNLIDNVFLRKSNEADLRLNKGFVFFKFTGWRPDKITQSIVYFTMLAVLHNHRNTHRIKQSVYERFLLDPENFNRFNDGILQAALLRCSTTLELDYQNDEKYSKIVSDLINSSINEYQSIDSAPHEFLMALCIGKLKIMKADLVNIIESNNECMCPEIIVLLAVLKKKFLSSTLTREVKVF